MLVLLEHHFKKWYLIFTEVYKNKACPLEFTTFLSDDLIYAKSLINKKV